MTSEVLQHLTLVEYLPSQVDSTIRARRRLLHQLLLDRHFDRLHAAVDPQLLEDIRDMEFDRVLADAQHGRNLFVGQAARQRDGCRRQRNAWRVRERRRRGLRPRVVPDDDGGVPAAGARRVHGVDVADRRRSRRRWRRRSG